MNIGKQTLKRLVLIIAEIIVSPLTLLDRLGQILGADHIFSTIGTALSLIPG
ncbi:MAG TPA: acyltransferase, partial [Nitrospirae bacterium]|nr:acyltransferase [Nitrospirota bacterium]